MPFDANAELHDIVLDYVRSLKTEAELRELHRGVISKFVETRPPGPRGWTPLDMNPMATYVVNEIGHHIANAKDSTPRDDILLLSWLDSWPADSVATEVAKSLGIETIEAVALQARKAGEHWKVAVRCYHVMLEHIRGSHAGHEGVAVAMSVIEALEAFKATEDVTQRMKDHLVLEFVMKSGQLGSANLNMRSHGLLGPALQGDAAKYDCPMSGIMMSTMMKMTMNTMNPGTDSATIATILPKLVGDTILDVFDCRAATHDKLTKLEMDMAFIMIMTFVPDVFCLHDDYDKDIFYPLDIIEKSCKEYEYDRHHEAVAAACNGNDMHAAAPAALPVAMMHGDAGRFFALMEHWATQFQFFQADNSPQNAQVGLLMSECS